MADKILMLLLFGICAASGAAKLLSLDFELEAFARWGYPLWFMYLTGALEVLGAIALLIRPVSALTGAALAALMIGAIGTHAINAEWPAMLIATAIFAAAVSYTWRRREDISKLLGRSSA